MKDIIKRHGAWLLILLAASALTFASVEVTYQTMFTIAAFAVLGELLIYFSLHVFTSENWVKILREEIEAQRYEKGQSHKRFYAALAIVVGTQISVRLFVAICVFAIYFTKYSPIP